MGGAGLQIPQPSTPPPLFYGVQVLKFLFQRPRLLGCQLLGSGQRYQPHLCLFLYWEARRGWAICPGSHSEGMRGHPCYLWTPAWAGSWLSHRTLLGRGSCPGRAQGGRGPWLGECWDPIQRAIDRRVAAGRVCRRSCLLHHGSRRMSSALSFEEEEVKSRINGVWEKGWWFSFPITLSVDIYVSPKCSQPLVKQTSK